jgi:hypothetical protein
VAIAITIACGASTTAGPTHSAPSAASPIPTSPPARSGAALVFDAQSRLTVLFGGHDMAADEALNDVWTWDGAKWTRLQSTSHVPPRQTPAAAYDGGRGQIVMFGGEGPGAAFLNDTWTWDGQGWHQQAAGAEPSGRADAVAAYDPAGNRVFMFGGDVGSGFSPRPTDETWTWDGGAWTPQHPAVSPAVRSDAAMAYDGADHALVLFGGLGGISGKDLLADTWTWTGTSWLRSSPKVAPSGREGAAIAYDAARRQVVLFGGTSDHGPENDTWTWDGSRWSEHHPSTSPPAGSWQAAAFDSAMAVVVLVDSQGETWTWDGVTWTRHAA